MHNKHINTHKMDAKFEIVVEYESLKEISLVIIQETNEEVYWRLSWDRQTDLLEFNVKESCGEPLPDGAMEEGFIILNERIDVLEGADKEEDYVDDYTYNGVRRSDFY